MRDVNGTSHCANAARCLCDNLLSFFVLASPSLRLTVASRAKQLLQTEHHGEYNNKKLNTRQTSDIFGVKALIGS